MNDLAWEKVTRAHPCVICEKPDWCSRVTDGSWSICRRIDTGEGKRKVDQAGGEYWVYGANGRSPAGHPKAELPCTSTRRADPQVLDETYGTLLKRLALDEGHREKLRSRGLSDAEIDRRGYRTLAKKGRYAPAGFLIEHLGTEVCRLVPGFRLEKRGAQQQWTLAGCPGLLIPVRDSKGLIVALRIRADGDDDGSRYHWFSSSRYGGPGPGAPVHIPSFDGSTSVVRVTEGELKADVATSRSGVLTVSVPGVSIWRPVLPVLRELAVSTVLLAFDADASRNRFVAGALVRTANALALEGFEVVLERWPEEHGKGIDDVLVAGHQPVPVTGSAVWQALVDIAEAAGARPDALVESRAVVLALPERMKSDPAVVFQEDALKAFTIIESRAPGEWTRLKPRLKAADRRLSLTDLKRAMRQHRGPRLRLVDPNESEGRSQDGRPAIVLRGGALSEMVDVAENALLSRGRPQLYQRGGMIVRVIRTGSVTVGSGVRREMGTLLIHPVGATYLVEQFTLAVEWSAVDGRSETMKLVDCPNKVAETYLARVGEWNLPPLAGIIETPTLRPDGSILDTSGYDKDTGLLFDPGTTQFAPIPECPAEDEARVALQTLREILDEFPFVSPSDESVALSAILTGLVRRSIRSAPMHAFRSPKMRTGKSALADIVSILATGRPCAVMSQASGPEDESKRLLAVLLAGDPIICYDNVDRPFGGAAICQALTQESITDRVLGVSKMATVPTASTFLATGNNLTFVGDITARVLVCDLDPQVEHPEERKFKRDLYTYVAANRGRLAAAALTVLRAYHVAKRPDQQLPRWAGFDEWSGLVRSALVWAGRPDPCVTRSRIEEQDPVRRSLTALLTAWHAHFESAQVTAAELVRAATPKDVYGSGDDRTAALRDALFEVAGRHEGINTHVLGNYLQANAMRIEGSLRIERMGTRSGVVLWRVGPAPGRE